MWTYPVFAASVILGATAGGVQADSLSQLKAGLETLNSEVSALELAATVPASSDAGIVMFQLASSHPKSASIKWQGYVRAIVGSIGNHQGFDGDQSHSNHPMVYEIPLRAQLEVIAKTDSSVGEVGLRLKSRVDYAAAVTSTNVLPAEWKVKEAWGWWSFGKHWTIAGGYTNSLGNMDYGLDSDGSCTCYSTNKGTASDLRQADTVQFRLIHNDGPLSISAAVQSALAQDKFGNQYSADASHIAFASALQWNGKGFDSGVFGYYAPLRQGQLGAKSEYQLGLGFDADLTKFANVSIGVAAGRENIFVSDCNVFSATFEPTRYYAVSGLLSIKLTDAVHAEVGYARKYYRQACHSYKPAQDVAVGIYYEPVKKLTLGVEGEWIPFGGGPIDAFIPVASHDETRIALVTKFRF